MDVMNWYDHAIQSLCVFVPCNEDGAKLMEELGISLHLNLAACWLKLWMYEAAKHHYDLTLKLDLFNVKLDLGESKPY